MDLSELSSKQIDGLTESQREWFEASSASLPDDVCSTKEYKSIKMKPKTPRKRPIYAGCIHSYAKQVFND